MEYYLVIKKKNKILIHLTTRMNLKNIMLNKKNNDKRPNIIRFHLFDSPE